MLNLDQIKQLEIKVSKAIQLIQSLKEDNDLLKLELHDRQKRIDELENIVLVFKNDQAKIEEGIINALNHLSAFEDTVYQAANSTAATAVSGEHQAASSEAAEPVTSDQEETAQKEDEAAAPTQETANNTDQMEIF